MLNDLITGMLYLYLPGLAVVSIVALPAALALGRLSPTPWKESSILIVGLSFCGYVVGVVAGNSRSPITETLLTAMIGLMTGLVAYVHAKESVKTQGLRTLSSVALIALLSAMVLGLLIGGTYKKRFDAYQKEEERYGIYFSQLVIPLCLEEQKRLIAGSEVKTDMCAAVKAAFPARMPTKQPLSPKGS
ncbi:MULTISPECIES: hypothetical protein [unclassified Variovorax]|jgi:4-amino-4-deoxy-L-arabinose transferase-like glycosyltransferase|uniref:hypothetical protein n=1 Tax=unclassified Variovorax TaxID=663243 RepID=UPI000F7E1D20|nr:MULTISPECIES: hypothetical protein [unclassified Variovorax]RSZ32755.1 hypothetical protein EJO70_29820 [Variovorax sp. 553]RSZ33008.1 hypothetical protein EJO71_29265 [Variovorax sp. 679]